MKRKIYNELLKWKNNNTNIKPLMILGVRQCGKTYIINEFCKNEYKHYKMINLFNDTDVVKLYKSNLSSSEKYKEFKLLINFDFEKEDSILFIDEIQECEELISELKYFCEMHNKVRIICAGSLLGVKLNRLRSPFPVGKIWIKNMYPLDFEEFLTAYNREDLILHIKECFINNKSISDVLHEKLLIYYRTYLITGGMPESISDMISVNNDYINYNKDILSNITTAYINDMKKHVSNEQETLKIEAVYRSLPSQLSNVSKKFQYSLVNKNARSREYESSVNWLINSNMVLKTKCVTLPQIPLEGFSDEETFKLYLSDVGILNSILGIKYEDIITDKNFIYKGFIAENYVANQLKSNGINLYYWKNDNGTSEIDFLLNTKDGIIPIEVKSGDNTQSKSLKVFMDKNNSKYAIRISTKNFGFNPKTNIKSIPLYAVCLLKEL